MLEPDGNVKEGNERVIGEDQMRAVFRVESAKEG